MIKSSHLIQIQPERDVAGTAFPKGQINFNWSMDSSAYFNPHLSFIKMRVKLTDNGGNIIATGDNIAPNMFMGDAVFQAMKMNLNNVCISEMSDYVPQCSALKRRMQHSNEELEGLMRSTNMAAASFAERQAEIIGTTLPSTSDVTPLNSVRVSRNIKEFELIFKPALAFFDLDEYVPGCQGLYNLQLTPHPAGTYEKMAIESTGADKTPGATGDFIFEVVSMNLYLMRGLGDPVTNKKLTMSLTHVRCQTQNLTTNSLHQKTFQVHPRTTELTLAYQTSGASISDTQRSASKFRCASDDERKIRRFWLTFGGKQLPTPIADPEYNTTSQKDYLVQRYVESIMYTNLLKSPESLDRWLERGWYAHFSGYSPEEKDDRVYVSSQFDAFGGANPNVLLFDWYKQDIEIYIENSRIAEVKVT